MSERSRQPLRQSPDRDGDGSTHLRTTFMGPTSSRSITACGRLPGRAIPRDGARRRTRSGAGRPRVTADPGGTASYAANVVPSAAVASRGDRRTSRRIETRQGTAAEQPRASTPHRHPRTATPASADAQSANRYPRSERLEGRSWAGTAVTRARLWACAPTSGAACGAADRDDRPGLDGPHPRPRRARIRASVRGRVSPPVARPIRRRLSRARALPASAAGRRPGTEAVDRAARRRA